MRYAVFRIGITLLLETLSTDSVVVLRDLVWHNYNRYTVINGYSVQILVLVGRQLAYYRNCDFEKLQNLDQMTVFLYLV